MKLFDMSLAFIGGALCVFGFAPFGLFAVPLFAQAVLFFLWYRCDTPRRAGQLGFFFGLGLFGAGINWIYVSLHDFGGMPMALAAPATLGFSAFLALFTALAGYLQARFKPLVPPSAALMLIGLMPSVWVLIEWLRGMIFTGFPWLTLGYAHSNSALAGYAPLIGVYGVSMVSAMCAGLLAFIFFRILQYRRTVLHDLGFRVALFALVALWGAGSMLRSVDWTTPFSAPFSVTLVQGNIPQDIKFNEDELAITLDTYRRLAMQNPAHLIILPETALPMMRDEVPQNLLDELRDQMQRNGGDMLIGVFDRDRGGYYNSVFTLGASENAFLPEPHYRKHHLVIFGEFIPLRSVFGWLINDVLSIPMGDLARGADKQEPMKVSGQRVAVDICYEDVFGEEVISSLPEATLLVNLTNDGWFGHSNAAEQHNQMSQFRALETGRMMLRATNTGVSSIISAKGHVLQQLPQHQQAVLQGMVQGYQGSTPYVRWGNRAVLLLIVLILAGGRIWQKYKSRVLVRH